MTNDTLGLVCEHGMLARACEVCEMENEITALRAEVEELRAWQAQAVKSCSARGCETLPQRLRESDAHNDELRSQLSARDAEVQALYSRAVGPYTDVQVGIRHDIEPNPSRTYLAFGVESLLPYWFKANAGLFVGERGQVLGRLEGSYDFQLTQRLVLQPRAELNLAVKNDAAIGVGSGLSDAEVGLRLRYEIRREFAPYVGVSYERSFGDTADFVRAHRESAGSTRFVVGLRAWF